MPVYPIRLGISDFFHTHVRLEQGNSWTVLNNHDLIPLVMENWSKRIPGAGETGIDRKVLVPITSQTDKFYCPPKVEMQKGLPVHAEVVTRQEGEKPYIQTFTTIHEAEAFGWRPEFAKFVQVVCYSAEALLENDGKRSGDADWEMVTLLCSNGEQEPMTPLTMARNYLEMPGGTKGEYTAKEFAEAIWFHANRKVTVKGWSL